MRRFVAVLDTGAGPGLIHKNDLSPEMEKRIMHDPSWNIRNANNSPIRTFRSMNLPICLGMYINLVEFVECDESVVPITLDVQLCDEYVEAMYARKGKS